MVHNTKLLFIVLLKANIITNPALSTSTSTYLWKSALRPATFSRCAARWEQTKQIVLSISFIRIAAPPLFPIMPRRPVAAVVAMNQQGRKNKLITS
jgi:hypothetical protein